MELLNFKRRGDEAKITPLPNHYLESESFLFLLGFTSDTSSVFPSYPGMSLGTCLAFSSLSMRTKFADARILLFEVLNKSNKKAG